MKKYRSILILIPLSFLVQYFGSKYSIQEAVLNTVFQLIASGLIGWVFFQYWNKYYNSSRTTWWARFYLLMIVGSLIVYFLPE